MEIKAGRLKELTEFEKNIETAYGRDQMKEFEPIINQMKRPALEATATRMLVLRDKKTHWDIALFSGGGLIAISALMSSARLNDLLTWIVGIASMIGIALIITFICVMIKDERKAKREAKEIVSQVLAQPRRHSSTEQKQAPPEG